MDLAPDREALTQCVKGLQNTERVTRAGNTRERFSHERGCDLTNCWSVVQMLPFSFYAEWMWPWEGHKDFELLWWSHSHEGSRVGVTSQNVSCGGPWISDRLTALPLITWLVSGKTWISDLDILIPKPSLSHLSCFSNSPMTLCWD